MSGRGEVLRDAYATLFKHHGLLPDEVGRQNPYILFKMLDSLTEAKEQFDAKGNKHLEMFYGE